MLELRFMDSPQRYEVEFASVSDNVVSIKGNIPMDTSGFLLSRIGQNDAWDYTEFTTINKVVDDVIFFSNDGSVFEQTTNVSVIWNDENDKEKYRPSSVSLQLVKNGESEELIINESDDWKKIIVDKVYPATYSVNANDIPEYTVSVNGTTITYTHEVTPEPQPEEPTVEERLTDVETAVLELYELVEV